MLGILFLSILFFGGSNYYSIFLAMFYNPSASLAYASIMYINNEIYYGWWMRALHANGASWFFFSNIFTYGRSIYYVLIPTLDNYIYFWINSLVVNDSNSIFSYVLPWGQMSFRAAMVITSLLSAIPVIGPDLVFLLWVVFQ